MALASQDTFVVNVHLLMPVPRCHRAARYRCEGREASVKPSASSTCRPQAGAVSSPWAGTGTCSHGALPGFPIWTEEAQGPRARGAGGRHRWAGSPGSSAPSRGPPRLGSSPPPGEGGSDVWTSHVRLARGGDSAVACAGPGSPGWRCSRRALGEARGAHPAHCPTAGQWRPLPRCASLSWRPALEAKALSCRSCPLGCDESVRERGGLSQTFLSAQREAEQPGPEKPLDRSAQLRCRHGLSSAFLKCAF